MINNIYALGETVYDIIFKNGKPVSACPGGSVLNSSVSLGRCGLQVHFISEYGNDIAGKRADDLLKSNYVNTDFVFRFDGGKTKLALAFLNDHNNAVYEFYKQYPVKRLQIKLPDFNSSDILLFGSYFSVDSEIRTTVKQLLDKAKSAGCLLVYDPNYRKAHLDELNKLKPNIIENIEYADIIRASNEDMKLIFEVDSPDDAFSIIKEQNKILIYTQGKNDIHLFQNNKNKKYTVPGNNPISTIAAGDNFNAGIIYSIFKKRIIKSNLLQLTESDWNEIVKSGIDFAADVCLSYDNYIRPEFAKSFIE
ncbi:MAG: carbohydrate kinase [Bacteroidetes bacterium]|nr:MAG: carbohydrate kinase [Bacteroidota bacterium]